LGPPLPNVEKIEILFLSTLKDIINNPNKFSNFNFKLSNFIQTMTSIITERLQEQYDSSNKSYKGKIMSGRKERATKQYFKDTAAHARRKQGKTRFDTHRRDEQPDPRDLWLEDIHFANFLGSKCEEGIPYNNVHINEPVNITECDTHLKPEPSKNVAEEAAPQEEEGDYINYYNLADYINTPQIQLEANTVWNMNWIYEPETQTLTGYSTFKRGHEEDDESEESAAKRMRSESYEISRMEEGAQVFNQEEINFAAMVAYMKEQVALAEQLAAEADELYPCDCLDCRR
jgi:hypothetical protein